MITFETLLENLDRYPNGKPNDLRCEIKSLNALLDAMEDGQLYRCKDLVDKVNYCWTYQAISGLMRKLRILGLVEYVELPCGEPITITTYERKEIIVNGEIYYSAEEYPIEKTVVPRAMFYKKL